MSKAPEKDLSHHRSADLSVVVTRETISEATTLAWTLLEAQVKTLDMNFRYRDVQMEVGMDSVGFFTATAKVHATGRTLKPGHTLK